MTDADSMASIAFQEKNLLPSERRGTTMGVTINNVYAWINFSDDVWTTAWTPAS